MLGPEEGFIPGRNIGEDKKAVDAKCMTVPYSYSTGNSKRPLDFNPSHPLLSSGMVFYWILPRQGESRSRARGQSRPANRRTAIQQVENVILNVFSFIATTNSVDFCSVLWVVGRRFFFFLLEGIPYTYISLKSWQLLTRVTWAWAAIASTEENPDKNR